MTEPGPGLTGPVLRGGAMLLVLRVLNRGLLFLRTFILARLLAPGDFGLMGMALLAVSVLETFSETGFRSALIQREQADDDCWDTAFWISAGRGLVLGGALVASAPAVAGFFHAPESVGLIRLIALVPVLTGLANPGIVSGVRAIDFKRQFAYELGTNLVNTAIAVGLGVLYRNVWALVWGLVLGQAAGLTVSWTYRPRRVRARVSGRAARELFGFGRWLSASSGLNFLLMQGDDILVGRMLGPVAMGFYQMAYRISHAPMTEFAQVVGSVTLPAFARMAGDLERTRQAFLRVLSGTTVLSLPLGLMIIIAGPDFTLQVLGAKWMPMVPALQVLGIYGMIHALGGTLGPVFVGMGRPDLLTKLLAVKLAILAALIFPLIPARGILGAAMAVAGATVIMNPISDLVLIRLIKLPVLKFLGALGPGLVAGAAAAAPALAALMLLAPGWVRFGAELGGALTGYGAAVIIMEWRGWPTPLGELRDFLRARVSPGNEADHEHNHFRP